VNPEEPQLRSLKKKKKRRQRPVVMAHACNSIYSEGEASPRHKCETLLKNNLAKYQWSMPVILAIQEAEIRRITV
jgi:hypothetical protein